MKNQTGLTKVSQIILVVALILAAFLIFKGSTYDGLLENFINYIAPCQRPITYRLGSFDNRFDIGQKEFLDAITQAENVWEKPIGKQLFSYSPNGYLKINLIYDSRQEATEKLRQMGITIHDDQDTYNTLKAQYSSLKTIYDQEKSELETSIASYENQKKAFETEATYWNSRGGAPKNEYERLQEEKNQLDALVSQINAKQASLNQTVEKLNATVDVINRLTSELNLNVAQYNYIGKERGPEFEEGIYQSDETGTEIDIYQFDDKAQLVRVLAHELGHALGLPHVDDPKAIMYRLNQGKNETLTPTDLEVLKNKCGLK